MRETNIHSTGKATRSKNNIYFAETADMAGVTAQVTGGNKDVNRLYARRIVACVNICEKLDTELLEAGISAMRVTVWDRTEIGRLRKQHDKLLLALVGLKAAMACYDKTPEEVLSLAAAESAIANARGIAA